MCNASPFIIYCIGTHYCTWYVRIYMVNYHGVRRRRLALGALLNSSAAPAGATTGRVA